MSYPIKKGKNYLSDNSANMETNPRKSIPEQMISGLSGSMVGRKNSKSTENENLNPDSAIELFKEEHPWFSLNESDRSNISDRKYFFNGKLIITVAKATLVTVVLTVMLLSIKVISLNHRSLFLEQFQLYEVEVSRGDDESINDPIVNNYLNGNYEDLISIDNNNPADNNATHFLVGCANLNIGKVSKAIESFEKIINEATKGGSIEYLEDAEYYLALSYLALKKMDKSHWFFAKIYHDRLHSYHSQITRTFYWEINLARVKYKIL